MNDFREMDEQKAIDVIQSIKNRFKPGFEKSGEPVRGLTLDEDAALDYALYMLGREAQKKGIESVLHGSGR